MSFTDTIMYTQFMHNLDTFFNDNRLLTNTKSILDLHYFTQFEDFLKRLVAFINGW